MSWPADRVGDLTAVLIRGRQLDGPHLVPFDCSDVHTRGLPIERVAPRTRRGRASSTRLRAPGCYGYQIDGATFGRVVVFLAAEWSVSGSGVEHT